MTRKFPGIADDTHRMVIVGQTGSGKTAAGVHWLSHRSYNLMPWIVVNYKNDELLNLIPGVQEIGPFDRIPNEPGLYMVRPECEEGSLDPLLLKAHARGGFCGFYIDEGYEVGAHSRPFRRVLTQGRSMRIPAIILSQRPVYMSKFVFTEAQFVQAFRLMAVEDRKRVIEWLPNKTIYGNPVGVNYDERLGEYQSLYFDGVTNRLTTLGPVPFGQEVLNVFDMRRPKRIKRIG